MNRFLTILSLFAFSTFATQIDLAKSKFTWHGSKITGTHEGVIGVKSAELKGKADSLSGGTIVMDMSSIAVTDLEGEMKGKLEGHMKSEDFFDVIKFPTSTLEIEKVEKDKMEGKLTIKGKTEAVSFPYKKTGKTYTGTLEFDRTKFDMIYGSQNFFKNLGDKVIHNEVKLDFNVTLK